MNQQNKIFETKISGAWGATSKLTLKFKLHASLNFVFFRWCTYTCYACHNEGIPRKGTQ